LLVAKRVRVKSKFRELKILSLNFGSKRSRIAGVKRPLRFAERNFLLGIHDDRRLVTRAAFASSLSPINRTGESAALFGGSLWFPLVAEGILAGFRA
jgi:hypothetical protein